jgi:hypothetical protein
MRKVGARRAGLGKGFCNTPRRRMAVPEALIEAYRKAEYVVLAEPPFALRIGAPNARLDALLAEHGAHGAAFITACNPRGARRSDADNAAAMAVLRSTLKGRGYACIAGEGRDPQGAWPAEPSVLVLGVPRDEAESLGRAFGQNAIVHAARAAAPELVLLG